MQMTDKKEELGVPGVEKRNWKGMLIAILVIVIVCGFVVLAVILSAEGESKINYIEVEDITNWKQNLLSAKWSGEDLIWKDRWNNIRRSGPNLSSSTILISNTTMKQFGSEDFKVSDDKQLILFIYNMKKRNSFSFDASYTVFDIKRSTSQRLVHNTKNNSFQFVAFVPNSHDVIYVIDGQLYYRRDVISSNQSIRISDSKSKQITSAIATWLYEEEVLRSEVAHWWSPDSRLMAYLEIDDEKVPDTYVTDYITKDSMRRYPKRKSYACPKVDQPNPVVRVIVWNKLTSRLVAIETTRGKTLEIFHSLTWSRASDVILITWSDRTQRDVMIEACNVTSAQCRGNVTRFKSSSGWISNLQHPPLLSNQSQTFFWLSPTNHGSHGDYQHIEKVDFEKGPVQRILITSGLFEVNQLLHFDVKTRFIYFLSNQADPKEQNIYKISVDHPGSDPKCLTCHQTIPKCLFYSAQFSPLGGRCFLNCLGPRLPTSCILKIDKDEWMCSEMINLWDDDEKVRFDPENFEFRYEYAKTRNGDHSKN